MKFASSLCFLLPLVSLEVHAAKTESQIPHAVAAYAKAAGLVHKSEIPTDTKADTATKTTEDADTESKKGNLRNLVNDDRQDRCPPGYCEGYPWGEFGEEWIADPNIHFRCVQGGMVAITYDDGPSPNTQAIVDILNEMGAVATFFINGYRITEDNKQMLATMESQGHSIASHSYGHTDVTKETDLNDYIRNEMIKNEEAVKGILRYGLGKYFRPPKLEMTDEMSIKMMDSGYKVSQVNLDSQDWRGGSVEFMLDIYRGLVGNTPRDVKHNSYITLQHDTLEAAIPFVRPMVNFFRNLGYKLVTIQECLGDPTLSPFVAPTAQPTVFRESAKCRGDPCPDVNHCRSSSGYCGTGKDFCEGARTWSYHCLLNNEDTEESVQCTGEPCEETTACRSYEGFCGQNLGANCNPISRWRIGCEATVPPTLDRCRGKPCPNSLCRNQYGNCDNSMANCASPLATWSIECIIEGGANSVGPVRLLSFAVFMVFAAMA